MVVGHLVYGSERIVTAITARNLRNIPAGLSTFCIRVEGRQDVPVPPEPLHTRPPPLAVR